MFGIRFRGHPNLKRILMYDEFVGHPLRKDYPVNRRQPLIGAGELMETRDMLLNVGPAHPAMHGIIRIITTLDGEQIVDIDVEIGYLHRGFEKMAETVDYNGVMPYTDRLNYVSPLINNMGYCMAVEKLLGMSVPGSLPLHPGHHVGDLPDFGPSHVRGRQRHGAGRVHGVSLHDQGPRVLVGPGGDGDRGASHGDVLSRRRSEGGSSRGIRRGVREGVQGNAPGAQRVGHAAHAQPHLRRSHVRDGEDLGRGCDLVRHHRTVPARLWRRLRRAEGLPVLGLRPARVRRAGWNPRRQPRSLHGPHGGDGTVHEDRRAGASETFRTARYW